jgi:hypothetical protein
MGKGFRLVNLLCFGAGVLLVVTFFYPLWCLTAQAVQYETEFPEGLKVYVYLFKIGGDVYELNIMNTWIGAHFPEQVPEMVIFPVFFGGLAFLCFGVVFLNHWKASVLKLALILCLLLTLIGAGSLQWRLYTFGHQRDPHPPISVPDFTAPVLGSMKLWNWKITTRLDVGAYTIGLATLLVTLAYIITGRESREKSVKKGEAQ